MRINKYVAQATGMSRRDADKEIEAGRITLNEQVVSSGQDVSDNDKVYMNGHLLVLSGTKTIILNKPVGYVSSRDGQGSKTIYHLIPDELHILKPVGRLDKDSSGLLIMTNDGKLAQILTHPSFEKQKIYKIELDKPLVPSDKTKVESGVMLDDGVSTLKLIGNNKAWTVTMHEGRNRQIRRTFEALGYRVIVLNRTAIGDYKLGTLELGKYREITDK